MTDYGNAHLYLGDSMDLYGSWQTPMAIISDGAYGIDGFDGDMSSHESLADWYEPHVEKWSSHCGTFTTLWFFNTEIGWANVHPVLKRHGWKYVRCCIWDKGIGHVAGRCNTKTLNQFPCSSEVAVQYVRDSIGNIPIKNFLRDEWLRTGLPLNKANEACGVKNAATRKYLTADSCFYIPPDDKFAMLKDYANENGDPEGKPYFDTVVSANTDEYLEQVKTEVALRMPKFNCPAGMTNVWSFPHLSGRERVRVNGRNAHPNQKPLALMDLVVKSCTDEGDVVWEPFGGLFSASLSAVRNGRIAYGAEINSEYYEAGKGRFNDSDEEPVQLNLF